MRKSVSSSKAITSTKDLQAPTNRQPKTYEATDHGLIRWEYRNGEWTPIQIANFTARVIEDLTVDDGVAIMHEYRVEAVLNGGKKVVTVDLPSSKFDRMNWMGESLGIGAIVNASCERHVRAAIKYLSIGQYSSRDVYRHTGWRKVGGRMVYLHAGGAIGKAGPIRTIETKLSKPLADFVLPAPPRTLGRLQDVIGALLRFLDIAPDRITIPLLSATARAILGRSNLTMQMTARYESGKGQLSALMQQCFAPAMNSTNLHIAWSSSENFLEQMAFEAKDAILVIDDFKPNGTYQQKQEWHAKADRVLRAQGNRSGRGRLNADLETIAAKPPRGMILSTGEETPNGQSLQARMVILDLGPEDVDSKILTQCQEYAAAGIYAEATAAFIRWLPDYIERIDGLIFTEINRYRRIFHGNSKGLKRAPDNIFQLAIALRVFLSFTLRMNALTLEQVQAIWSRATQAFSETMRSAQLQQRISDPELRFFELISALISSGEAHIADGKTGGPPPHAEASWGWQQREDGRPGRQPLGKCLGWLHKEGLFLQEPEVWPAVSSLAERCNERFDIPFTQLKKQLLQRKFLMTSDIETPGRRVFTVRKTCAGKHQSHLLHVSPKYITGGSPPITADKSDKLITIEAGWAKLSEFAPVFVGEERANRQILKPSKRRTSGKFVGNVGSYRGGEPSQHAEGITNLSDAVLASDKHPTNLPPTSDKNGTNGHRPEHHADQWQRAGFESEGGFAVWYEAIYANHPTRGGLQVARDQLAELVAEGAFEREKFETGYQCWRQSSAWTRESGRFIPKLSTFIEDKGWMFPPADTDNSAKAVGATSTHSPTAAERRAERLKNI